ncbi:hypothetical protein [Methylobacterium brachiatum]|nr:hypothetical protein [Methylobacterium brachiatum]
MSHLTADNLILLAFFTPIAFSSGLFLIIRDLPVTKRFLGEVL